MTIRRNLKVVMSFAFVVVNAGCSPDFLPFDSRSLGSSSADNQALVSKGQDLYRHKCLACHGPIEISPKLGRSESSIRNSLTTVPEMKSISFSDDDIKLLALALDPTNNKIDPLKPKFMCNTSALRGRAPARLRRLSRLELTNTLESIVTSAVAKRLQSLTRFTNDPILQSVTDFTNAHSFQQVESLFQMTIEAGELVVDDRTSLNSISPSCLGPQIDNGSVTDGCISSFIAKFGERAFRRPLTSTELGVYLVGFKNPVSSLQTLTTKERVALLISRILGNPKIYFHFEEADRSFVVLQGRERLDAYSIASRLSYQLTAAPPDDELLSLAAQNRLSDLGTLRQQARRLVSSTAGRKQFRQLVDFWLQLGMVSTPSATVLSRFNLNPTVQLRTSIRDEAVEELLEFTDYVVYQNSGTFDDLMTTNISFPRSSTMASILSVNWSGTPAPVATLNARRGLLLRPALLLSNLDRERPIRRGSLIRQRVLCDVIPPPPADVDQIATDNVLAIDPTAMSIRELTSVTTKNSSCAGCHSQINPLGFVLGSFGALGERISVEKVYSTTGVLKAQFTPNTSANSLNVFAAQDIAQSEHDLVELVSRSSKAKACLPTMMFRFANMRMETENDTCLLSEAERDLRAGKPIKEAIINVVVNEDIFWRTRP